MLGWQFNTVGVSDGITMGGEGMRFSLQTREIIADSIETVTCAQHHDANISIPGCDKNMPGVIMAAARHNRPFVMIYGGTIMKGHSKLLNKDINISTVRGICNSPDNADDLSAMKLQVLSPTASSRLLIDQAKKVDYQATSWRTLNSMLVLELELAEECIQQTQ